MSWVKLTSPTCDRYSHLLALGMLNNSPYWIFLEIYSVPVTHNVSSRSIMKHYHQSEKPHNHDPNHPESLRRQMLPCVRSNTLLAAKTYRSRLFEHRFPSSGELLYIIWLDCVRVLHLLILGVWLCSLPLLLLSPFPCLDLGLLRHGGLLLRFQYGLALLFNLVVVALDNGASDGADLFDLTDVDGLRCVFALIIEPVLLNNQ